MYSPEIMTSFHIGATTALRSDINTLRSEAAREGFGFIDRLVDDWRSGANRFDQSGELFLGGFLEDKLVAVCGLNRDPYTNQAEIGRLRHLYVEPTQRRRGIASALVRHILGEAEAESVFQSVRLRTPSHAAAAFYAALGFLRITDETATHTMALHDRFLKK